MASPDIVGKRRTDLDPTFLQGVELTIQRRGARVVEWAGFENRCAFTGTVGSNPTLSASFFLGLIPGTICWQFLWKLRYLDSGNQEGLAFLVRLFDV